MKDHFVTVSCRESDIENNQGKQEIISDVDLTILMTLNHYKTL